MKRWYLSDVTGTGTFTDPIRPVTHDLQKGLGLPGSGCASVLQGARALTLMEATAAGHLAAAADTRVDIMPELTLGDRWDSIAPAARAAIRNRMIARGFDVSGVANDRTFGEVLRSLGQQLEPEFDETRQGVG